MYKCGLLVLTCPLRSALQCIVSHLKVVSKSLGGVLYVKLEPGRDELLSSPPSRRLQNDLALVDRLIPILYNEASTPQCRKLNVYLLLGAFKNPSFLDRPICRYFDVVFTDSQDTEGNVRQYVLEQFQKQCSRVVRLEKATGEIENEEPEVDFKTYENVVLGGTFDVLHNGHKMLLTSAVLRATKRLIVGVTDGEMLATKLLWELVMPVESRVDWVKQFLKDIDSSISHSVAPIYDPYGPTIIDPDIDCIVVSDETKKGGVKVNEERAKRGMKPLDMVVINLVEEIPREAKDENRQKISSSHHRTYRLGSYIKFPDWKMASFHPTSIGLVGEVEIGRSRASKEMESMGLAVLDCNSLVDSLLEPGSKILQKIVEEIGQGNIGPDGLVTLKGLYAIALRNKDQRKKISSVIRPELKPLIQSQLAEFNKQGFNFVAVDMPIFTEVDWFDLVHEVWFTIIPYHEKIQKLEQCYSLTSDEAKQIACDTALTQNIARNAHVILCPTESPMFFKNQVKKAWESRLPIIQKNPPRRPRWRLQ